MFKEVFINENSGVEKALDNVMEIVAADAIASGGYLPEVAIDSFETWFDEDPKILQQWKKMPYKEKMKIAKKLAKQYQ